jgi:phosphopantothenoylcysteine decarboxylase/phosphopantothenate--cysteine ligase
VLVTAGPTEEPIDPVRMITNASSGKMGFAVARACRDAGAEVTLVSGPVALATPPGVARTDVRTAAEMFEAVKSAVPACDVFFSIAAVSDYRVANRAPQKIKKNGGKGMTLDLVENPDILAWVAGAQERAVLRRLCRGKRELGRTQKRSARARAFRCSRQPCAGGARRRRQLAYAVRRSRRASARAAGRRSSSRASWSRTSRR